jgi:hypothetical protein
MNGIELSPTLLTFQDDRIVFLKYTSNIPVDNGSPSNTLIIEPTRWFINITLIGNLCWLVLDGSVRVVI